MTLTIKTIAEMAQVSCTTVSRVLNNRADVKPETREKILAIVEKSGFQPNAFARGIQSKKSRCIGLIIPHKMAYILSDNFYTQIILGLSDGLLERNYFLLVCNTENIQDIINIYRQKRADGFVFIRLGEDDLPIVETLNAMNIPFISTAKLSSMQKMIHVDIDNYAAACQAMEYLISLGHREIGMIVESNTLSCSKERCSAYRDTMRKHGFAINEKIIAYAASNMQGDRKSVV
jgi:DNA-binding LacI/PurR family transcriptional regulator